MVLILAGLEGVKGDGGEEFSVTRTGESYCYWRGFVCWFGRHGMYVGGGVEGGVRGGDFRNVPLCAGGGVPPDEC